MRIPISSAGREAIAGRTEGIGQYARSLSYLCEIVGVEAPRSLVGRSLKPSWRAKVRSGGTVFLRSFICIPTTTPGPSARSGTTATS